MRIVSLLIAWSFVISQGTCECHHSARESGPAFRSLHHAAPIALSQGPRDFPARDIVVEDDLEESESEEDPSDAKAPVVPMFLSLTSRRHAAVLLPDGAGTFVRPILRSPILRC